MRIPSVAICTLAVLTAQDLDHQGYAASPDDLPGQAASQKAASSRVIPVIASPVVPPETVAVAQTVILGETIAPIASTEIQVAERTIVPVITPATVVPSETVVAEKVAPAPVSPTGQAAPTPVSPIVTKSTAAPEVTPDNFLPRIETDSDAPKEVSPRLDPSEKTITSSLPTPSNTAAQPALDVGKPPDPTLIATAPLAPKPDFYVTATAPVRVDPTIKSDTPITDQNLPLPQWATQVRACMAAPEKIVINANGRSVCPPTDPVAVVPTELPPRFRLAPGSVVVPTSPVPVVRPTPQASAPDVNEMYKKASRAVVYVGLRRDGSKENDFVSSGSGFIITSDGYIITNAHVVAALAAGENRNKTADGKDSTAVIVALKGKNNENRLVRARVAGFDYRGADLALLKILEEDLPGLLSSLEPENLPFLHLAQQVKVGETVYAIGSPLDFGFSNLFTSGIVSGLIDNFVVTNAESNPGNSGGPLLNSQGEVIGVMTGNKVNPKNGSIYPGIGLAVDRNTLELFVRNADIQNLAIVAQQINRTKALKEIEQTMPIPSLQLQVGSTVFGRLDYEDSALLAEFDVPQNQDRSNDRSNYEAYRFKGSKGKRITIEVKAIEEKKEGFIEGFTPQLMIVRQLNNGEKQILPVSAQTKGLDSTLEFPVPEDGTYFLVVGSSKKGEGGSYKLTVK